MFDAGGGRPSRKVSRGHNQRAYRTNKSQCIFRLGIRKAAVGNPAVAMDGTFLGRMGRMQVMGPGQKLSAKSSKRGGISAAKEKISWIAARWIIKGFVLGRPLVDKFFPQLQNHTERLPNHKQFRWDSLSSLPFLTLQSPPVEKFAFIY